MAQFSLLLNNFMSQSVLMTIAVQQTVGHVISTTPDVCVTSAWKTTFLRFIPTQLWTLKCLKSHKKEGSAQELYPLREAVNVPSCLSKPKERLI